MNKALVGRSYPPQSFEITAEWSKKYALAYNEANPWFLDESRPGGIVAPPLFGVVFTGPALLQAIADPELGLNFARVVHGEQEIEFIKLVKPGDVITSLAKIVNIEEKSSGEILAVGTESKNQHGELVQRSLVTLFVRGEKKGAGARSDETKEAVRDVAFTVEQTIAPDQTFRYAEASGDRNPIHTDEAFAKSVGLPGIIVHGLCVMAFVSKAFIDTVCDGNPSRLKRMSVRFAKPVFPGQTITTKAWVESKNKDKVVYGFETYNPNGESVIKKAMAEIG